MSEPIIPVIRLPVRPESVMRLDAAGISVGGVRMRTTIYIVQEADMPGANQAVTTVVVPTDTKIELRIVE